MPTPGAAAPQQQEGGGEGMMGTVRAAINGVLIFVAVQSTIKWYTGSQTATVPSGSPDAPAIKVGAPAGDYFSSPHFYPHNATHYAMFPDKISPIWPAGTDVDINVYLHESLQIPELSSKEMKSALVAQEKNFKIGDWNEKREVSLTVPFSESVKNNGTLYAHIFVARHGKQMDPRLPGYEQGTAFNTYKLLTRYYPKKKVVKTKKLVGGGAGDTEEELAEEEKRRKEEEESWLDKRTGKPIIRSYWHSNLTLDVVGNNDVLQWPALPPALREHVVLEQSGAREESGANGWYYPIVYPNDFWLLRDHMVEINNTVSSLPLHIAITPTSFWKFQMYSSMDFSFKQSAANPNPALGQSASTGAELEEFKRVLIETNIYLLGTTFFVSILHSIFEALAFKNDIAHWRKKKDNVGVSVRTILANVVMQTIIFLYLLDNNEDTSWMILIGQGFGILLEAWKITRTVDVKIEQAPGSLLGYKIAFKDKHQLSELEKETKAYDEEAFKYMYWVAVPLLLAYAGYSLMYQEHKSLYSFVISTLVGSVYAYGFLMMVPSLYINYKLKSVAHMPRKTMIYKLLNTFIDDLFAFTIKMPTLHRLATLRDDVIYFIALYQSWVYRVDYRRVNEFGQGGDDDDDEDAQLKVLKEAKEKEAAAAGEEPKAIGGTESVEASGAKVVEKKAKKRK